MSFFGEMCIVNDSGLEKKTIRSDFFGIWQQLGFQVTCIKALSHIRKNYATLPTLSFIFWLRNQILEHIIFKGSGRVKCPIWNDYYRTARYKLPAWLDRIHRPSQ